MSFYKQYTSPLGYVSNGNSVDTYGVDHSGFTTRDELQYQTARINRENDLMTQMNNQGMTTYPQYGTNFWGTNADNNYGFGTSNISNNIENRQQNTVPTSIMPQQSNFGYPELRADKRNIFNSAIENFVSKTDTLQSDANLLNQVIGAARDLGENYINMVNANYKSTPEMQNHGTTIDNYYHCIGNYNAAQRGIGGVATASVIDVGREIMDYPKNIFQKNKTIHEANNDFINDMKVNIDGQKMAQSNLYSSAFDACEKYRPKGYNPDDRLKYYRKY